MEAEILVGQLKAVGVVVDPSLTPESASPETLYAISYDACKVSIAATLGADGEEEGAAAAASKAHGKLPSKYPQQMTKRVDACQRLLELLSSVLSVTSYDANTFLYPNPTTSRKLLSDVANATADLLERTAAAATGAEEEAAAGVHDDDDADEAVAGGGGTVGSRVSKALGLLRRQVTATDPHDLRIRIPAGIDIPGADAEQGVVTTATVFPKQSVLEFCSKPVQDPSMFEGNDVTVIAQVPGQRDALPSLVEYLAASECGTREFQSLRKRRLAPKSDRSSGQQAARLARLKRSSAEGAADEPQQQQQQDQQQQQGTFVAFFGTAETLDTREAQRRREAAEALADAETKAVAEVESLEGAVQDKRTARVEDDAAVREKIKASKQQLADLKAVLKEEKDKIRAAAKAVETAEADREARTAELEQRRADAEARQQLIVDASNPQLVAQLDAEVAAQREAHATAKAEFETRLAKVVAKHTKLQAAVEAMENANTSEQKTELKRVGKELKRALRAAQAEAASLQREWDRCPKTMDRTRFSRIVTDMSTSLRKQQVQIDDVLRQIEEQAAAIRGTQAEVKTFYETVEEHIYKQAREAKGDGFAKKAYAGVIDLRDAYVGLVSVVEQRGQTRRDQFLSDARHAKLSKSVGYYEEAGQAVGDDLQTLKAETAAMAKQLQALQSKHRGGGGEAEEG